MSCPFPPETSSVPSPSSPYCTLKSYRSKSSTNSTTDTSYDEEVFVTIKSKFGSEFRRVSLKVSDRTTFPTCSEFTELIFLLHGLTEEQRKTVHIAYTTADGSNLPISNDENLRKAVFDSPKVLRLLVQNRAESLEERFGYGLRNSVMRKKRQISISNPQDFRRVSSIIDTDILPPEVIRVRLCKFHTNLPLGFFIRDGLSERLTNWGPTPVPSIFISRLLPSGLAASTNLLHEGDEILEVNGIDVYGKTLDQVTDIMIANATNLVLTVRPAHTLALNTMPRLAYAPPPYPSQFSPMSLPENLPMPPIYSQAFDSSLRFTNRGSPIGFCNPREIYRMSDKFSRASLNTASTSSAGSSGVRSGGSMGETRGNDYSRSLRPKNAPLTTIHDLPHHLPPTQHMPPPMLGPHPIVPVRRIPRPFSMHTDGFVPQHKQVPIEAYRYSTVFDRF
ncbi:unnamed protein product, partial [Mesorhabditis belari]|uniref:Uncharacterized protein n=1 Tax=Mesorhabditis belari TaxID=2138241 RepID=A0AAF3FCJ7_9BILA